MTELEKIVYTKSFIDKLADGIDPTDGTVIPEGDVIRKPRLVGCLKYVSELFSKVIENPEAAAAIYKGADWMVTPEVIMKIQCYSEHVSISALAKRIDEALCSTRKFTAAEIHNWLIEKGYLTRDRLNTGRTTRNPTQRGLAIGIRTDDVPDENGVVKHYVWCDHRAQVFIKNHLEEIVTLANSGKRAKRESRKIAFSITQSELSRFEYSETPLMISQITDKIKSLSSAGGNLKATDMTNWLVDIGFLEIKSENGKNYKIPTDAGSEIGIRHERKMGNRGEYISVTYDMTAQKFIVDNIHAIVDVV